MKILSAKRAVDFINHHGVLLVFPLNNAKEPASLWSCFFPRTQMRWEWDSDGDDRVGSMWMLMKKLSDSGDVVYSKWYQGRATFFSKKVFTALICLQQQKFHNPEGLSHAARSLLETLESDSPLSTKQLKKITELQGKDNERFYTRGMRELFQRFLIVAYGEVDDGAFPSLAVGSTRNLFEDLVHQASDMKVTEAEKILQSYFPVDGAFRKFYKKTVQSTPRSSDS